MITTTNNSVKGSRWCFVVVVVVGALSYCTLKLIVNELRRTGAFESEQLSQ